jgi:predicted nucleotidyltransferase
MFGRRSIFNKPFEKILKLLVVDHSKLVKEKYSEEEPLGHAPDNIKKLVLSLIEYAKGHNADVLLFGSRVKKNKSIRSDWDFGIYFQQEKIPKDFSALKGRLLERAFPYRADIVVLNYAPDWFLDSIEEDAVMLTGERSRSSIFRRRAA